MEPTSWKTAKEIIDYLYEQGMLSASFNEETESVIKQEVCKLIENNYKS